jgi:hypothetical protein
MRTKEHKELKSAVDELLNNTIAPGNGGYTANFGAILYSKLVRLSEHDISKYRTGQWKKLKENDENTKQAERL